MNPLLHWWVSKPRTTAEQILAAVVVRVVVLVGTGVVVGLLSMLW